MGAPKAPCARGKDIENKAETPEARLCERLPRLTAPVLRPGEMGCADDRLSRRRPGASRAHSSHTLMRPGDRGGEGARPRARRCRHHGFHGGRRKTTI